MKKLFLIVGIAIGMNSGIALAQHEKMPGHENMPPGDHAKHGKKDGKADKKQPSRSDDKKKRGDADKKRVAK